MKFGIKYIKMIGRARKLEFEKDKTTNKDIIDLTKFGELNPPSFRKWKNKKEMKAYKRQVRDQRRAQA